MPITPFLSQLAAQHRRIIGIVDGLDEAQLRSLPVPSGWSPLSMINHVGGATSFWLFEVMLDRHPDTPSDDDFAIPADTDAAALLDRFQESTRSALAAVSDLALSTEPAWWPEGAWGGWRLHTLNEILLHLVVETACHAGHLDVARELIDGGTWNYATGQVDAVHDRFPQ
jgi:uncharacterized damage-inducible protein DinB